MAPPTNPEPVAPDPREALQEVLRAIQRNLLRVVFMTLVFLMLGAALVMIWPNKYESNTQFVLRETKIVTDAAVLGEIGTIPLARKLQSLQNELGSSKRVQAVMDELQWKEWLETAGHEARRRALYAKLKRNLDVLMNADVTGGINVSITFQWTSPEKAADFVNRLRDSWIKLVLDSYRKGLEQQKELAEQVVLDREAEYEATLAAMQKYEQENDVPSLLDFETNNAMKADFLVRLSEAKAKLESTVTKIEILRSELQAIPREQTVLVQPENREQLEAKKEYQRAEAAFLDAKATYKPVHAKYVQAQQAFVAADRRLKAVGGEPKDETTVQTNPAYFTKAQELERELEAEREHRALVTTLEAELLKVDSNLQRLPRVTMDKARLMAAVTTAGELMGAAKVDIQPLRDRVKSLRNASSVVGQSAGLIGSGPFEILELGIEPDGPVLPMGAIIMALALIVGVGLGLAGPVVGQLTHSSFSSVKEVSRSLGVPVLGAVDLILTARDVRARYVQSVLTITTMALVLLALGTALYIYAVYPEVLPATVLRALRDMRMALT